MLQSQSSSILDRIIRELSFLSTMAEDDARSLCSGSVKPQTVSMLMLGDDSFVCDCVLPDINQKSTELFDVDSVVVFAGYVLLNQQRH